MTGAGSGWVAAARVAPAAGAPRPGVRWLVLGLLPPVVLVASGCSGHDGAASSPSPGPAQVELHYTVPAGMSEIPVPSSTPTAGMRYDIRLFHGPDECQLRVVRLVLPRGDGTEDEDATYNMLGAIMRESGITSFSTDGFLVPGRPGPVPALMAQGHAGDLDLRAAGRVSNQSLQGFQLVYGCPRGRLTARTWQALTASMTVDGYTGPLTMH